jgi:hypothetical protein
MKKILSLMILLAGVISFTACGDDDPTYNAPAQLSLKSADAFYAAAGGTGTIVVNTSESITATSNVDWLTASVSGSTVTLTVAANDKLEGRSTNILLKSASASKEVNITQRGIIYGLPDGLTYAVADTANARVSIPVVQSASVTVTSLTEWLTASFNSETSSIEVVAASNDVEEPRLGYVAFQTGNVKDTLEIAQAGLKFNIEKTSIAVPNEGGIESVTIEHSRPVTVEDAPEWVECVYNDKTGVLALSIDENRALARQGTITLKSLDITKTISVIQYDPASLADQIVGDYYFTYYDDQGAMKAFAATLTEEALQLPALGWSIPVTIDKENLTVSVKCGSYVGTFDNQGMPLYMYMLFMDETGEYLSGEDTESVVSAALGLEDIGGGELTLAGDFAGTFGEDNDKFGSFYFAAFSEQSLDLSDEGPFLGRLLQCYYPGLMKMPAEEEESAPAMLKRATKVSNVPLTLKKQKRFK